MNSSKGVRDDPAALKLEHALARFSVVDTGGQHLAIASAHNYRVLRSQGCTVRGTIDCLIATLCILHGYALLHRDRDFDHFEKHLKLAVVRV